MCLISCSIDNIVIKYTFYFGSGRQHCLLLRSLVKESMMASFRTFLGKSVTYIALVILICYVNNSDGERKTERHSNSEKAAIHQTDKNQTLKTKPNKCTGDRSPSGRKCSYKRHLDKVFATYSKSSREQTRGRKGHIFTSPIRLTNLFYVKQKRASSANVNFKNEAPKYRKNRADSSRQTTAWHFGLMKKTKTLSPVRLAIYCKCPTNKKKERADNLAKMQKSLRTKNKERKKKQKQFNNRSFLFRKLNNVYQDACPVNNLEEETMQREIKQRKLKKICKLLKSVMHTLKSIDKTKKQNDGKEKQNDCACANAPCGGCPCLPGCCPTIPCGCGGCIRVPLSFGCPCMIVKMKYTPPKFKIKAPKAKTTCGTPCHPVMDPLFTPSC